MNCPACGALNPSEAETCIECGASIVPVRPGTEDETVLFTDDVADETLVSESPEGSPEDEEASQHTIVVPDHQPDVSFGPRYQVKKLLGRGGMGAVYRAWDVELERDVALKEIRPELADQPELLARFKREIQLASEITDPNVLRVYDLAEAEGKRFLTMQFVEGQTLAAHLRARGRPPVEEILPLFHQLCSALAAAHAKGVVHRDLKPDNVMIAADGTAYVMDFGLARSVAMSGMTQTGAVMGTPHFMSPEQVMGQKVDARTDVYALGLILYQMLTGQLPFSGESSFEVMMARTQRDPPPAHELNPEIPDYLRKILERCIEQDISLRYPDAGEILADLDAQQVETRLLHQVRKRRKPLLRFALAALLILIVVGGFWLGQRSTREAGRDGSVGTDAASTEAAVPAVPSLAVVPFTNRTGDAELDWFGEGIARLVMDNLAQSRHVQVVSMDRVQKLIESGAGSLDSENAATAGIENLMTGEIIPGPEGLTVTARLTSTAEGRELFSERLDGLRAEQLIQSADDLASSAREGLGIPPTELVDVFAADFASKNAEAYQAYVAGLGFLSDYQYQEAERELERALEQAPDFTMARYRLALLQAEMGRTEESLDEIQRAVDEMGDLPLRESLYMRAGEAYISRRYDEAVDLYRELIESFPYETEARYLLAYILDYQGRFDEEREQLDVLARLEPDMPAIWSMRGNLALQEKNFTQAVTDLRRYLELAPESANGHHLLGDAYRGQGELGLAAEEFGRALELEPDFHYSTTSLAVVEYLQGRSERAESRLRGLITDEGALPRNRIDALFELAAIRRGQGRFREAAELLAEHRELIEQERVREAMSLSVQGTSWLELGRNERARDLIRQSIERSPGVPTRYLFARGQLELAVGKPDQVRKTADQIEEGALPPDNPDRTEEKAAAYLRGAALLAEGDVEGAIAELTRAVTTNGYSYRIYRLELARAYLAAGRHLEAMAAAKETADELDLSAPRLDLELDRVRAGLVLAQVHAEMGRLDESAAAARAFLSRWSDADSGLVDVKTASRLAAERS